MNYLRIYILFLTVILSVNDLYSQDVVIVNSMDPVKKEGYIQKAIQNRLEGNFPQAIKQLDSILLVNPVDAPTLLFKGDLLLESKKFKEATQVFESLIPLKYNETLVKINFSYALFMNKKPGKALEFAKSAWENDQTNRRAIINYLNALLWNNKTKKAKLFLFQQYHVLDPSERLILEARLALVRGNFNKSFGLYDSLATKYPDKSYIVEYVEVLTGKKHYKKAREIMREYEGYFNETEHSAFNSGLSDVERQSAGTGFSFFSDSGENIRRETSAWWTMGETGIIKANVKAGYSNLTSGNEESIETFFGEIRLDEKINTSLSAASLLSFLSINPKDGNESFGFTGMQSVKYQPNDRRMIGLYYRSEILDYTASLYQKKIRSHNLGYLTHLMLSSNSGIYSEGSYGRLNDGNQKWQFFGSAYYVFSRNPMLKAGYNFSYLSFQNPMPMSYFSPDQYLSQEIFAVYGGNISGKGKLTWEIQGAIGIQKIEQKQWESSFRIHSAISYNIKSVNISLKHTMSNVASATGSGYEFNKLDLGFSLKL